MILIYGHGHCSRESQKYQLQIGFIPVKSSCTTAMQNQTNPMQRRLYVMNRCFDAHVMQP
jgi:hypothetical protein